LAKSATVIGEIIFLQKCNNFTPIKACKQMYVVANAVNTIMKNARGMVMPNPN